MLFFRSQCPFIHLKRVMIISFALSVLSSLSYAKPSLRGGRASLDRQNQAAQILGARKLRTPKQIKLAVKSGKLVRVKPTKHLQLANVSFPFAHPKLKRLLTDISQRYHQWCKAPLVVTSLTRPQNKQPRNASSRSVHPAGIAADLRLPWKSCRRWLERYLLELEAAGVIEATRERRPPHFHITLAPRGAKGLRASAIKKVSAKSSKSRRVKKHRIRQNKGLRSRKIHIVRSGDTLWDLAMKYRTTVKEIRRVNQLPRRHTLQIGQALKIPTNT